MSCDLIVPGLYLGDYQAACDKPLLKLYGISTIISVSRDLKFPFPSQFTYFSVRIDDNPNDDIFPYFDQTSSLIHTLLEQGSKILVHCYWGVSRSVTLVTAFLMKFHNMKFEEAFQLVKQKHFQANPNPGFLDQLFDYEEYLDSFN